MPVYTPEVFPLMVPAGFVASRRVTRSNGTPCPNNPGGYTAGGQRYPSERPILYDSFAEMRGGVSHGALDITCADGTPVVSPVNGRVKRTWNFRGERLPGVGVSERGGHYVWIDGDDGFSHYFAHMRDVRVVPGQEVRVGQMIGRCSDTGSARGSCPHLHYAVTAPSGAKINPLTRLRPLYASPGWRGEPLGADDAAGPSTGSSPRVAAATGGGAGVLLVAGVVLAAYLLTRG